MGKRRDVFFCVLVMSSFLFSNMSYSQGEEEPANTFVAEEIINEEKSSEPQEILETEPEALEVKKRLKRPRFWKYCYRFLIAPVAVPIKYALNEESDIYETYLQHMNKGFDYQWKKQDFKLKNQLADSSHDANESDQAE